MVVPDSGLWIVIVWSWGKRFFWISSSTFSSVSASTALLLSFDISSLKYSPVCFSSEIPESEINQNANYSGNVVLPNYKNIWGGKIRVLETIKSYLSLLMYANSSFEFPKIIHGH